MTESFVAMLVRELLADPDAVRALQAAIAPPPAVTATAPAYTVGTLGRSTGLGDRAIRNAINRGELPARKRSGRWVITPEDVNTWLGPPEARSQPLVQRTRVRRPRPLGSTFDGIEGWR